MIVRSTDDRPILVNSKTTESEFTFIAMAWRSGDKLFGNAPACVSRPVLLQAQLGITANERDRHQTPPLLTLSQFQGIPQHYNRSFKACYFHESCQSERPLLLHPA